LSRRDCEALSAAAVQRAKLICGESIAKRQTQDSEDLSPDLMEPDMDPQGTLHLVSSIYSVCLGQFGMALLSFASKKILLHLSYFTSKIDSTVSFAEDCCQE
jgi:hypothetical protein